MGFKNTKPAHIIIAVAFLKWIVLGLSYEDTLGVFVLIAAICLLPILENAFPKPPDVKLALEVVHKQLLEVQQKQDEMEHDLTALKFGSVKR